MADGVMSAVELIETLIIDCNDSVKYLATGEYVRFCNNIVQMVKKLGLLRDGVRKDSESKEKTIADLKRMLANVNPNVQEIPVEEYIKEETGVE